MSRAEYACSVIVVYCMRLLTLDELTDEVELSFKCEMLSWDRPMMAISGCSIMGWVYKIYYVHGWCSGTQCSVKYIEEIKFAIQLRTYSECFVKKKNCFCVIFIAESLWDKSGLICLFVFSLFIDWNRRKWSNYLPCIGLRTKYSWLLAEKL